jgi:hypothetical protein
MSLPRFFAIVYVSSELIAPRKRSGGQQHRKSIQDRTCNSSNPAKLVESHGQRDDIEPFAIPCYEEIPWFCSRQPVGLRYPCHAYSMAFHTFEVSVRSY